MRRWFELHPSVLRAPDREDAGGGNGSDTHRVDQGAPHEVGALDHEDEGERPARQPAADDRSTQLQKDLDAERQRAKDAEEDARYWANRARRVAADADQQQPRERVIERVVESTPEVELTPEQLIDGLNKEGLEALYKAGFINQKQLRQELNGLEAKLTSTIRAERSDAEFGGRIAQEFPTIAQESTKLARAKAAGRDYVPTDPLFLRAGELYREAIADDPSLENSQGIILATARMAQRELASEGKVTRRQPAGDTGDRDDTRDNNGRFRAAPRVPETPARRRDRIDRQRPDTGLIDDENPAGGEQFTEQQQTVMEKLGVKPEKFAAHRDAAVTRQEGRRNGRR